jgi:hypothetical protein
MSHAARHAPLGRPHRLAEDSRTPATEKDEAQRGPASETSSTAGLTQPASFPWEPVGYAPSVAHRWAPMFGNAAWLSAAENGYG